MARQKATFNHGLLGPVSDCTRPALSGAPGRTAWERRCCMNTRCGWGPLDGRLKGHYRLIIPRLALVSGRPPRPTSGSPPAPGARSRRLGDVQQGTDGDDVKELVERGTLLALDEVLGRASRHHNAFFDRRFRKDQP